MQEDSLDVDGVQSSQVDDKYIRIAEELESNLPQTKKPPRIPKTPKRKRHGRK